MKTLKRSLSRMFLITAFLAHLTNAQAQRWDDINVFWKGLGSEEYDDNKVFYLGFVVPTLSISNFVITKSQNWNASPTSLPADQFTYIHSGTGFEMGVGIPVRFRLNHYWSVFTGVRFPNLLHYNSLSYSHSDPNGLFIKYGRQENPAAFKMMRNADNAGISGERNFIRVDLPLHAQLRSDLKFVNTRKTSKDLLMYRMYLLGGGSYTWQSGARAHYAEPNNIPMANPSLVVRPGYFSLEGGIGLDLYFTYFKLSPELKFSQSINNLLDKNRTFSIPDYQNPFMDAVDRLGMRSFQFSLIFE